MDGSGIQRVFSDARRLHADAYRAWRWMCAVCGTRDEAKYATTATTPLTNVVLGDDVAVQVRPRFEFWVF